MNSHQNDFQFNEYDMQALFSENLPDETLPVDLSNRLLSTILLEVEQVYAEPLPLQQRSRSWLAALFQNRWVVPLTTTAAAAAVLAFVVITRFAFVSEPSVLALAEGGRVEVLRENGRLIRVANGGDLRLFEGDTVVTQRGRFLMQWQDDQQITMAPNTRLIFNTLDTLDDGTQLEAAIDRGKIFADINRKLMPGRDYFGIQTPNGSVSVVGTEFVVRVDVSSVDSDANVVESSTSVTVREGEVEARIVSSPEEAAISDDQTAVVERWEVAQNWKLTVANDREPVLEEVTKEQIDEELANVAPAVVAQEEELPRLNTDKPGIKVLTEPNGDAESGEVELEEGDQWEIVGETEDGESTIVVNDEGVVGYVDSALVEAEEGEAVPPPSSTTEIFGGVPIAAPTSTPTDVESAEPIASESRSGTPGSEGRGTPGGTRVPQTPVEEAAAETVTLTPVTTPVITPTTGSGVDNEIEVIAPGPTRTATAPSIATLTATATATPLPTFTSTPDIPEPTNTPTSLPPTPLPPTNTATATATATPVPPQPTSAIVLPTSNPTQPGSPLRLPTQQPTPTPRPTATWTPQAASGEEREGSVDDVDDVEASSNQDELGTIPSNSGE